MVETKDVTVRFEKETVEKIDEVAEKWNRSRAYVVREIVTQFLERTE